MIVSNLLTVIVIAALLIISLLFWLQSVHNRALFISQILKLYPPAFREEFGLDMQLTFHDVTQGYIDQSRWPGGGFLMVGEIGSMLSGCASIWTNTLQERLYKRLFMWSAKRYLYQDLSSQQHAFGTKASHAFAKKLIDLRVEGYPKAFKITEGFRGEHLSAPDLSPQYLKERREELIIWQNRYGLFLSEQTIEEYKRLRRAIKKAMSTLGSDRPKVGKTQLSPELYSLWEAKNDFRSAMRADLNLLHADDDDNHDEAELLI